ncbi:MAG TPA: PDZ domain-containing protein [Pyrinomonadaceae bacterium]|nr:PDZ domain-containing protein [Pyrinomonadaceae bacterium]
MKLQDFFAFRIALLTTLMAVCSTALFAQAEKSPATSPQIAFTVSMTKPHTHMLEVEVHIKQRAGFSAPPEERLVMPVWTPGSYLIREFERHVQDFAATDAAGQALEWEKINKNTWRVATKGSPEWRATYRVYANELSVRTNELNSDHAFWNNAALLMYLEGFLSAPSTLHVLAPQPWKVATGLPIEPGPRNTFRAENFDILYDSPVEVSNFKTLSFEVKGVPHRIVIDGDGNYEPETLRAGVQKVVETEIDLMGGEIPYRDYTFIVHLRSSGGGGLEHQNSTALGFSRFDFRAAAADDVNSASPNATPVRGYRGFYSLVAHEFFHLWNVKRIRPDALGPFDYTKENYTKLLWVAEGVTDYYARVVLRRSGVVSEKDFLAECARAFQRLQETPGRLEMSAEEASFDTWVKYYRQDENSINSQVDYYAKGSILGLLLDLEIRKGSKGAKSLDDVMRHLYTEFYKKGRNYTPKDFQQACELMAGKSLEEFFTKYVRGRDELDYNSALAAAGLTLRTTAPAVAGRPAERAYLGADLVQEGERLLVRRVHAGSPAYEQGLNTGDQIVAINSMRANKEFFDARLAEKHPGELLNLTVFRFDDLSMLPIKLGGRVPPAYSIVPVANPTDEQTRIYQTWVGAAATK